jgi:FlaG/FlaF family flagellin (archaellin)
MNSVACFGRKQTAISPIIATLLLILIAIAAGVVVYAYVIGFVGSSTGGGGNPTGQMTVDSATDGNPPTTTVTVYVRNTGSTSITISAVYLTDNTAGTTQQATTVQCNSAACTAIAPGAPAVKVTGVIATLLTAGDSITVKLVALDGTQTTFTFRA